MEEIRFYSFITIALISAVQFGCVSSSTATVDPVKVKPKADIAAGVKNADDLFAKRDESISNLREAVKILKQLRNPGQRDFDVEWKYAQCNYFLGKRTEVEKESDRAFEEGVAAGKIASGLEPEKPEGFFWFGANLGEQARRSPLTVGLTKVDEIRRAMLKVIELRPDYQGASAYDALSEIEMTTGLVGGKPENAVEFLEKALQIENNNTNLHLHLGKAYLAVDREADARRHLTQVLKMTPSPGFQFEYDLAAAEARKLLQTRF